jgi:hypothetical protein
MDVRRYLRSDENLTKTSAVQHNKVEGNLYLTKFQLLWIAKDDPEKRALLDYHQVKCACGVSASQVQDNTLNSLLYCSHLMFFQTMFVSSFPKWPISCLEQQTRKRERRRPSTHQN